MGAPPVTNDRPQTVLAMPDDGTQVVAADPPTGTGGTSGSGGASATTSDKLYYSAAFGFTHPNFQKVADKLGVPGNAIGGYDITLASNVGEGFPLPLVLDLQWGSYKDDGNPSLDHNRGRVALGFRTQTRWGRPSFNGGVRLDVLPLGVQWDKVAPDSPRNETFASFASRFSVQVACSNLGFMGDSWRGCLALTSDLSAAYALDRPIDARFFLTFEVEQGDLEAIKNPSGHWSQSLFLGLSALAMDVLHLGLGRMSADIGDRPSQKGQKLALDLGGGTTVATAQSYLLAHTGNELRYFWPPVTAILLAGFVESTLGGIRVCGGDGMDGACIRTGSKNLALGTTLLVPKLLPKDEHAWLWRGAVGLLVTSVGLTMALTSSDPNVVNAGVGLQNGATGGLIGGTF